ncbi:hypothetical protein [Elioraea sp.]|uniref:hypothetical protein n=1 Tax=Elioraea sp. TaxID=2185103 RepID=UPI003F70D084
MSDWFLRNVVYGVLGAALTAGAIAWLRGALDRIVPAPEVVWRRLMRLVRGLVPAAADPADNRFALLFAPLDGDAPKEEHTTRLLAAFGGLQGFRRLRADAPIRVDGEDLDQAERAAEERARALGRARGADLVVWGALQQGGKEIQLWLTPAHGAGSGRPLLIAGGAAAPAAAEAIAARLAALALAQLPEDDTRQRFLDASLEHVLARVEALLDRPPEALAARDRAGLERARADALARLGADLGDPARLRAALAAYEALHAAAEPPDRPELAKRIGEATAAAALLAADRALLAVAEARLDEAARGLGLRGGGTLAEAHDALGRVRYWRAVLDGDPALFDAAAEAFRDAASGFAAADLPLRETDAQIALALIEAARLVRSGDPAGMEQAAEALRQALGADATQQPRRQALAGVTLARIEAGLAQERGDAEALDAAARRAASVVSAIPRDRAPLAWAEARAMQASAEAARAYFRGDGAGLDAARRGIDDALGALPAAPPFFRIERARLSLLLAEYQGDAAGAEAARADAEATVAAIGDGWPELGLEAALVSVLALALAGRLRGDAAGLERAAAEAGALAEAAEARGIVPMRIRAAVVALMNAAAAAAARQDAAGMTSAAARLAALADEIPRTVRPGEYARVMTARAGILSDVARIVPPDAAQAAWRAAGDALDAVLAVTSADRQPFAHALIRMLSSEAAMRSAEPDTLDQAAARVIEDARAVERQGQSVMASNAHLLRAEAMLIRADHARDPAQAAAARESFHSAFNTIPVSQAPLRARAAFGWLEAARRTMGPGPAAQVTGEAARALAAVLDEGGGVPRPSVATGRLAAGISLVDVGALAGDRELLQRGLTSLRQAAGESAMPDGFRAEATATLARALSHAAGIAPDLVGPGEIAATLRRAGDLAEAAGHPDHAAEFRRMASEAPP